MSGLMLSQPWLGKGMDKILLPTGENRVVCKVPLKRPGQLLLLRIQLERPTLEKKQLADVRLIPGWELPPAQLVMESTGTPPPQLKFHLQPLILLLPHLGEGFFIPL